MSFIVIGVHMFNTFFFVMLTNNKDGSPDTAPRRHLKVAKWTKDVNIFEKNLLVIPICEEHHWYLVLVVKPGLGTISSEETNNNGEPFIILLVSSSVWGKCSYNSNHEIFFRTVSGRTRPRQSSSSGSISPRSGQ